jgi:hypothetical protein
MNVLNKTFLLIAIFSFAIIFLKSFAQQDQHKHEDDKAENLKILPKNISEDTLMKVMKTFTKSLGVKCNHCHTGTPENGKMKFNFASDDKPEKNIARKMMVMVDSINTNFIGKMGNDFERITCVTCHHGNITPIVSVDSLMKN